MIDLRTVFPQRRDGAIVLEECIDRRLIEDKGGLQLTSSGEAVVRGKAKPRSPLLKAEALLDVFLDRVHALNTDNDAARYVEEVWLFGSMLKGAETVGDIDLAMVTARRPQYHGDRGYEKMQAHLMRVLNERTDVPQTRGLLWSPEHWLTERALFGAKRHPLLAGVQDDISNLVDMGVPCRLVYDRARGGRISAQVLDRHPKSTGRRNDIDPPAELPDLTPLELKPMDARWVAGFNRWGGVSPYNIFRGWNDEAHQLFPRYPEGLSVATDDFQPHNASWLPKRLRKSGLNGRSAIALINANEFWGTSIVLRREIEKSASGWALVAWFEDLELFRRRRIEELTVPPIASAAALIIAVDAERMLRRSAEIEVPPSIQIKLLRKPEHNTQLIEDLVFERLRERRVRIEPVGWAGVPVPVVEG